MSKSYRKILCGQKHRFVHAKENGGNKNITEPFAAITKMFLMEIDTNIFITLGILAIMLLE